MKQKFIDKNLLELEWEIFSVISSIVGFSLAIIGTPTKWNLIIFIIFVIIFLLTYLGLYFYFKHKCKEIKLKIGKADIAVKVDDIFNETGLKVIPVNEYFDTQVDDKIIAHNTLHGMFVDDFIKRFSKKELDSKIDKELRTENYKLENERKNGKKRKYSIGTTIIIEEYILTALSKFNENNEAYLSMQEYLSFLNTFWSQINRLHNGRIVNVPIMGTGMARIDPTLTPQEYLEQIILSLKTSNLITSKCKINIIIYEGNKEEISLSRLKSVFNNIINK